MTDAEKRECNRISQRKWAEKNPERKKELNRIWREKNKDYINAKKAAEREKANNSEGVIIIEKSYNNKKNLYYMNIKRLSYGDWFIVGSSKERMQVCEIVKRGGWMYVVPIIKPCGNNYPIFGEHDITSIRLTEELLAKNNFVNIRDNYWVLRNLVLESFGRDTVAFRVMICREYVTIENVEDLQHIMRLMDMENEANNFEV